MTRGLAWLVVRLGFVLAPAWIVAAVAAAHYLPSITQQLDSPLGGLVPADAGAVATQQREVREFGSTLLTRVLVVQHQETPLTRAQIRRTLDAALTIDRHRSRLLRHIAFAAPLVSPNRTTTVTYLYFRNGSSPNAQLALAQTYARGLDPPGLRTGALLARTSEFDEITRALPWVTIATVALIVLVLLLTFRAPGPPLVVLGAAAVAYVVSVHLLAWFGEREHRQIPKEVEPVLVALLLGLVTDYAVFFVAGMRRHLAEGASRFQAADRTTAENLPIVVTAGLIVAAGSATLVVGQLGVFRAFGPGMALSVLVTLAVAVTFVPAVLTIFGRALFWPRLERGEREPRRVVWRALTARPVAGVVAAAASAGLVILALALFDARLGFTIVRGQPQHAEVKVAQENAQRGFAPGITAPTEVLLEGRGLAARRGALASFQRSLARVEGVARVVGPAQQPQRPDLPLFLARSGGAARYAVVLGEDPLDAKAIDVFKRLHDRVPQLLARSGLGGARVSYAGDTALAEETVRAVKSDGFRIGAAVLVANLVLLALFLRAVWAPLYLLGASVLALAAALGATTFVMQHLLHHDDLTYYVPFAATVLLLSLGSDYNVFVVGRIWQSARDRPLRDAIAEAAPRASRTVTIAGVTLAGSFALLALVPIRPMRELAFAMAAGILIDTFVVRSILVPSLLALFARREQGRTDASADLERPVHE